MVRLLFCSFIGVAIWIIALGVSCLLTIVALNGWAFAGVLVSTLFATITTFNAISADGDIDDFEQSSPEEVRARLMGLADSRRSDK